MDQELNYETKLKTSGKKNWVKFLEPIMWNNRKWKKKNIVFALRMVLSSGNVRDEANYIKG